MLLAQSVSVICE